MKKLEKKITGIALLREPFEDKHIGKLPKPLKWQTDAPKNEKKDCKICGGWHHPAVIHLDYVGHAALTDRLLDADPHWYWEPCAFTEQGLPAFDETGGLWIRLYVHDGDKEYNRLGYGHAKGASFKEIGSREKEVIGDALRNAAMRFGAALDLWHKGDLHDDVEEVEKEVKPKGSHKMDTNMRSALSAIFASTSLEELEQVKVDFEVPLKTIYKEWPAYMSEISGEQTKSFTDQIAEHKRTLENQDAVEKQQQEDSGFKKDFME